MTAIQLQQLILDNLRIGEDISIPQCEQIELFNDIKELYTALDIKAKKESVNKTGCEIIGCTHWDGEIFKAHR